MDEEYIKRDNQIGFLKTDMLNSYRVLMSHMGRIDKDEINAVFNYSKEDIFTIDVQGVIVQVNVRTSDCTMVHTGKSIRDTYPFDASVFSNKRLDRLIGWFESDIKDFCEGIMKLTKRERYELLSI